jgi:hypothetical protein
MKTKSSRNASAASPYARLPSHKAVALRRSITPSRSGPKRRSTISCIGAVCVWSLSGLDQLMEVFYRRAVHDADVQSGLLVAKLIERRSTMLGLRTPQQAVLQIVDSTTPKETTTDKIERVLREFAAQHRSKDPEDPTTH